MQLIAQIHSELKGKEKADSSKRQRVEEEVSIERKAEHPVPEVTVQGVDITSTL